MDSPRGAKRAAKRRLIDASDDYAQGPYDATLAANGDYSQRLPFLSNGGPMTPLRPNEDEALRAAKERRRARARKVYSSEEEEEEEDEQDYLSMLKVRG